MSAGVIKDNMPAQCLACANLHKAGNLDMGCKAFDVIPLAMIWGGDHREKLDGDRGVRFRQSDRDGAAEAFDDWQSAFGG